MSNNVLAIIPARYDSTRFPGKPLAELNKKSIVERLYRVLSRSKLIDRTVVATDSSMIKNAVEDFGGEAIMTSKKHRTGSDRSAEVAAKLKYKIIINIQADQLGLTVSDYNKVLKAILEDNSIKYATLIRKVESEEHLFDPNRVKVIVDSDNNAIWFSRFPLPFLQKRPAIKIEEFNFYYHIGVYFYRAKALQDFAAWPRTPHEKAESLEQLRILENGRKIKVFKINRNMVSIDTPEDLKKAAKSVI